MPGGNGLRKSRAVQDFLLPARDKISEPASDKAWALPHRAIFISLS
jgi:hypothetical protein